MATTIVACSGTLGVGAPLEGEAADTPSSSIVPASTAAGEPKYAWTWVNPSVTGVTLRAVHTLPSGERWSVGDHGTVIREIAGERRSMRVGELTESLSSVWGSGPDDVWIGGSSGSMGLLLHWDGEAFSSPIPTPRGRPIDQLIGTSQGLIAVVGGAGWSMVSGGKWDGNSFAYALTKFEHAAFVSDIFADGDVLWVATDVGVSRCVYQQCERVDTHPALGIWGDGKTIFTVASVSRYRSEGVELRRLVGGAFERIGEVFPATTSKLAAVRGGRWLAGDGRGHLHVALHFSDVQGGAVKHVVATFNEATGHFSGGIDPTPSNEIPLDEDDAPVEQDPLYREAVFGLDAHAGVVGFVGGRGLYGHFQGAVARPQGFRRNLHVASAAPGASAFFARCAGFVEAAEAVRGAVRPRVCRFDPDRGWSVLPPIADFVVGRVVATSSDGVFVHGGSTLPNRRDQTWSWDRGRWTLVMEGINLPTPLFAFGPADVWGRDFEGAVHFDGERWNRVGERGQVAVVGGTAPDDVWISGTYFYRWDGRAFSKLERPSGVWQNSSSVDELGTTLVAVPGGAWVGATTQDGDRILSYDQRAATPSRMIEISGFELQAIGVGPDGKVRALGRALHVHPSLYVDGGSRLTMEAPLPEGVVLTDLVKVRDRLFAVGSGGATMELTKVEGAPVR